MKTILAKSISYGGTRSLSAVKAIVIHNTGNNGDTAENNGNYFKNGNTRSAGAHIFIDQKGNRVLSIPLNKNAYAVGGSKWSNGGGKYYGTYNNSNTVSIELCDIVSKDPSAAMIKAVKTTIAEIKAQCPNATKIIRHYDVNGKPCPERMVNETRWNKFLKDIGNPAAAAPKPKNVNYTVKITADVLNIRASYDASSAKKGELKQGSKAEISQEYDGWGKLKNGKGWIKLSYTKKVTTTTEPKKTTETKKTETTSTGYKVKVTADVLNIRKSASADSAKVGSIKKGDVYTIVQEKNGWGKLKSGAGWIKLSYTKKV